MFLHITFFDRLTFIFLLSLSVNYSWKRVQDKRGKEILMMIQKTNQIWERRPQQQNAKNKKSRCVERVKVSG